jgi:MYXO-CTERM domain-containing protein
MRLTLLVGALVAAPVIAAAGPTAQQVIKPSGSAAMYEFVAAAPTQDDLLFARQVLPANDGTSAVLAQSKIIFLNYNTVTLSPGTNDSRTNRSTIAAQQTTLQGWTASATTKAATTACMKELFAPFDVVVTDVEPPSTSNYIEAIFGGSPTQLGLPTNVAGVSPFTTNCSIIENSIVFTFTQVLPENARLACEIMAQEVAHSYGLDHELLASDPMTYLDFNGNRAFQNQTVSCGEFSARSCGINGSVCRANQNSVTLLTERLGTRGTPGDTVAPDLSITFPQNNATVPPGFKVDFNATDNIGVTQASLFIDGVASGSVTVAPFEFTTPDTLTEGAHTIRVDVTDGANSKSQEITVTVQLGAPPDGTGGDNNPPGSDNGNDNEIVGGCSSSQPGGLLLAFALCGLAFVRRRR